jgi:hypothetical protein
MRQQWSLIVCGLLGSVVGLAVGYFLFASTVAGLAPDDVGLQAGLRQARGWGGDLRSALGRQPSRERSALGDDQFIGAPARPGDLVVDWEKGRANVPIAWLEHLDLVAFTSDDQSPWGGDADAFVISPELNEILQLDASECDAIQMTLLEARRRDVAARWATPAGLTAEAGAVVIEIAPAAAEVETSIRESLGSIMGEQRAAFFLNKIQATLDWEYGGFGSSRRRVEVSILPDDTISIRESLRSSPSGSAEAPNRENFELKTRQQRVDQLPASIAALVQIEE